MIEIIIGLVAIISIVALFLSVLVITKKNKDTFESNIDKSKWNKLGQDLRVPGTYFGWSVSLSNDGNIVAIYSGSKNMVKVYEWNGSVWTQLGQDLLGNDNNDHFGWSVSLSGDGSVIAIGAPISNAPAQTDVDKSGYVKIYKLHCSKWKQLGQDIEDKEKGDRFGWSVSLSDDGNRVAISAIGDKNLTGKVKIYELNNDDCYCKPLWTQLGIEIKGNNENDYLGWSVSLSGDGETVAIGAPGSNNKSGKVNIHKWNGGTKWNFSHVFNGDLEYATHLGNSVSLSKDGNIVAFCAYAQNNESTVNGKVNKRYPGSDNNGKVKVYKLNGSVWTQLGQDAFGVNNRFVSLSGDGNKIAIGYPDPPIENPNNKNGKVKVYKLNDNVWTQYGKDIEGNSGDYLGFSPSLSKDGTYVAAGSPGNGKANVYILTKI